MTKPANKKIIIGIAVLTVILLIIAVIYFIRKRKADAAAGTSETGTDKNTGAGTPAATPKKDSKLFVQFGDKGANVKALQIWLNKGAAKYNFDTIITDGIFGNKTKDLLNKIAATQPNATAAGLYSNGVTESFFTYFINNLSVKTGASENGKPMKTPAANIFDLMPE